MSEYKCSMCEYRSNVKGHVMRHINKKNKCTCEIDKLFVIEIVAEIKCEHCEKKITLKSNLKRHQDVCKVKIVNLDNIKKN